HVDLAGIVHVDLDSGLFDDAADHLSARPNQVADLVDRNLQCVNARSEGGNIFASAADDLLHLVQDEHASTARLFQRLMHDLGGDAHHLDIHLQSGNALAGAGDLEVHIAVMVFGAGNVGEDGVGIFFLHQAHGDSSDR